jgi:hypothetical protein
MPNGHSFSFPYGVSFVLYPVLAVAVGVGAGRWWGVLLTVVAAALAALFTWEGLSRKQFEMIYRKDETLNRVTWAFNWLFFFALPGYLVAIYGLAVFLRR